MRKPGRCKHCSAALRPSYERCFPACAARREFEAKEGDAREERKRAKAREVEERSREVDRTLAEGRAVLERHAAESHERALKWKRARSTPVEVEVEVNEERKPVVGRKLDKLGTCKHCSATILLVYDSCSDCTSRLEFPDRMKAAAARTKIAAAKERERAYAATKKELACARVRKLAELRERVRKFVEEPERKRELERELERELDIARQPVRRVIFKIGRLENGN